MIDSSNKINKMDSIIAIGLMILYDFFSYLNISNKNRILDINTFLINIIFLMLILTVVKIKKQKFDSIGIKINKVITIVFSLLTIIYILLNYKIDNYIIFYLNIMFISILHEVLFRGFALKRLNYWLNNTIYSVLICGFMYGVFCFIFSYNRSVEEIGLFSLILFSFTTGIILQILFSVIFLKTKNIAIAILLHMFLLVFNILKF